MITKKVNAAAAAKATIITMITKKVNAAAAAKATIITTITMKKVNAAAVSRRLDSQMVVFRGALL